MHIFKKYFPETPKRVEDEKGFRAFGLTLWPSSAPRTRAARVRGKAKEGHSWAFLGTYSTHFTQSLTLFPGCLKRGKNNLVRI